MSVASVTETQHLVEPELFDAAIIPAICSRELPEGYTLRPLRASDYERGVLDVLRVLTTVGDVSKSQFQAQFDYWLRRNDTYFTIVIANEKDQVVAVGSIVIERKLIHECGLVGHIEDIAVARSEQGKKLGFYIIHALTNIGKSQGAYKVILDCSDHNVKFYEKCGYSLAGVQMSIKFNNEQVRL
ncbi:hypothetical protein TRVA0_080S00232 [Trichomonascus vanleenenianus]|uniref:glucosamine 6-phosphate N-acetyltransferase n=1 Tax=Trichomonascus vanleenenianus TaxID=2268995 RepID=UPI003ECAF2ED